MYKKVILVLSLALLACCLVSSSGITVFALKDLKGPNVDVQKITLVTRHYGSVYIQYNYVISAKVFYAYTNHEKNYDQFWGTVQGAQIAVKILNPQGKVVKSFSGLTDSKGYYNTGFRIPDDFVAGQYLVVVTAQKGSYSDTNNLSLFVQASRR